VIPTHCNVLNQVDSPYTVSVYPIEQEPGVWFATYLISEYKGGMERILANVSLRTDVHRTEARARHAARRAGRVAIARLAASRVSPRPESNSALHSGATGAQHG